MKTSKPSNIQKRPSSTDSTNHNANNPVVADDPIENNDPPLVIFPEWADADIAAEKWATKHAFEDTEFLHVFPRSLRSQLDSYKRPSEFVSDGQTPVVAMPLANIDEYLRAIDPIQASRVGLQSQIQGDQTASGSILDIDSNTNPAHHSEVHSANEIIQSNSNLLEISKNTDSNENITKSHHSLADPGALPATSNGNLAAVDEKSSKDELPVIEIQKQKETDTSKFLQTNHHLLHSELMSQIIYNFHFLFDQGKSQRLSNLVDEFSLYDCIYPKNKDGTPMYNTSGKYAIRLYWLGAWRKVIVDDRLPFSTDGKPLLPTSPIGYELWPYLISKGILKIAAQSYKDLLEFPEQGDFDVFHALKGWVPERLPVIDNGSYPLWDLFKSFNLKSYNSGTTSRLNSAPVTQRGGSNATAIAPNNSQKTDPYVIIQAFRDIDELQTQNENSSSLSRFSYHFRVCDYKHMLASDIAIDENEQSTTQTKRSIRIRTYYSVGVQKKSVQSSQGSRKAQTPRPDSAIDTNDIWISIEDFYSTFKYIKIYHNPTSFKNIKTIQCILDPFKPTDTFRIPPLLYSTDEQKDCSLVISASTFGRSKSDFNSQTTSISIEPYDWKWSTTQLPLIKLSTNGISATFLKLPKKNQSYRFIVDCPTSYSVSFYSRDDFSLEDESKYLQEKGFMVKDFEDTFAAQANPNQWTILLKNVIYFSEPTFLTAYLYVPDLVQPFSEIKIIDNDKMTLIPQVFRSVKPRMYHPNKNGYTLVADLKTIQPRNAGKWKVRLVSDPILVSIPEKPMEIYMKPNVQDFEEIYAPNKHNILFRSVLKVKDAPMANTSFQVTFSFPDIRLCLTLFDAEQEVFSTKGVGTIIIPSVILYPSEEVNRPEEKKVEDKKLDKSLKDDKRDKINSQGSFRASYKHKYILQATMERPDLSKVIQNSSFTEAARLSARVKTPPTASGGNATSGGLQLPGSAKSKKKSIAVPNAASTVEEKDKLVIEPLWHLRIITTDTSTLIVQKDTEKEDRFKYMKESWESSQPGRSMRAQELRETYAKWVENESVKPSQIILPHNPSVPYKPWMISKSRPNSADSSGPVVIAEEDWILRQQQRENLHQEILKQLESAKSSRRVDKETRSGSNLLKEILEKQYNEIDALVKTDLTRRSEYRIRLLKEIEEEAAAKALEAAKEAERLAELEENANPNKKKGGKK